MAIAGLSWINLVDLAAASLSASQEVTGMLVGNIADPIIGRRWRTTSLTAWGQVDFGSDQSIDIFGLRFPRDTSLPLSGTVRHQCDADGGTPGTGAAYDSTAISLNVSDGYGYHTHIPVSQVTARYWRFTFNVTGLSYIDVGRAWAGVFFQPTRSVSFGVQDEWADLSKSTASARSGAEFIDERARQRVLAFGYDSLETADEAQIKEMSRIAGLAKQVLFVLDPDSPSKGTVIGRMAQSTPIIHKELSLYSKAFVLRESL